MAGRKKRNDMRVLPNHPITDIAPSDSVMHVLYDIEEKDRTIIPGSRHLRRGLRRRGPGSAARGCGPCLAGDV